MFWAIRKLLEHLARERPLVVVIEDIHWAEPTLLDLIEHIADWSRDAPILLLCPARPELLDTRAGWGGGKLNATNVLLEPLGAEATARLIAALPGGQRDPGRRSRPASRPPPRATRCTSRSSSACSSTTGCWRRPTDGTWTASDGLAEVRIPASISALLSARLERLGPDERAVAERASVVGRVFEQAAVAELASDALRPAVGRSLLALVRKELVRPERSELTAGDAFKFRHILIRDAAYEALPEGRAGGPPRALCRLARADRRRAAGRVRGDRRLSPRAGPSLPDRARRDRRARGRAGRPGRDPPRGGRRASSERGICSGATTLSTRATRLMPVGSMQRLRLLLDLIFAQLSLGDVARSEQFARETAEEATRAGQPLLAVHAQLELALLRVLIASERLAPRSIALAAIPRLELEGDELGLARANMVLASVAWMGGQVVEATRARDRAMSHAERSGRSQP